jgi:hypothetical protein
MINPSAKVSLYWSHSLSPFANRRCRRCRWLGECISTKAAVYHALDPKSEYNIYTCIRSTDVLRATTHAAPLHYSHAAREHTSLHFPCSSSRHQRHTPTDKRYLRTKEVSGCRVSPHFIQQRALTPAGDEMKWLSNIQNGITIRCANTLALLDQLYPKAIIYQILISCGFSLKRRK